MKFFKKILTYSVLMLSIFVLNACFEDPGSETILSKRFVSFDNADLQITESSLAGSLTIDLSYAQSSDVQVSYEVEELGAIQGVDYQIISPNPIVIPANTYSVPLQISVVNNSGFEVDARQFKITITGVSGGSQKISIDAITSSTVTIVNDDCPVNTSLWYGTINLYDVGFSTTQGTGGSTAAGTCNILVIRGDVSGAGGTLPVSFYFTPTTLGATSGTVNVPVQNTFSTRYTYEGSGTYSEATKTILINYKFTDTVAPTGPNNWTGQLQVTKP